VKNRSFDQLKFELTTFSLTYFTKLWCKNVILQKSEFNKWMWSGAFGGTHDSGARGPGFDPTPKPRMAFSEALISLLSDNRLKNDCIHLYYCDVKLK
jgi:hypothetical protein